MIASKRPRYNNEDLPQSGHYRHRLSHKHRATIPPFILLTIWYNDIYSRIIALIKKKIKSKLKLDNTIFYLQFQSTNLDLEETYVTKKCVRHQYNNKAIIYIKIIKEVQILK